MTLALGYGTGMLYDIANAGREVDDYNQRLHLRIADRDADRLVGNCGGNRHHRIVLIGGPGAPIRRASAPASTSVWSRWVARARRLLCSSA
jgi:hypothetical protein